MKTGMAVALCGVLLGPASAVHADKKTDTVETQSGRRTTTQGEMSDRAFVEKAASANLAEVQMGKLAVEKGSSPKVKEFGQRMIDDHSKANQELQPLAAKKSLPMPTELDAKSKATYDKLTKLSGTSFDKTYMDAMAKDHDEDVKEFKRELSTVGVDPDVKAWAQKTLNVIEEHKHLAHQDKDGLKK